MTALGSWIELGTISKKSKTLRTYIINNNYNNNNNNNNQNNNNNNNNNKNNTY